MTLYNTVKIAHIISSSLLFGTGIGSTFYLLWVNCQKDIAYLAKTSSQVVKSDWLFVGIAALLQPLTGFLMIYVKGDTLASHWWVVTLLGYAIAGICWFSVIYLQMKCRDMAISANDMNTVLNDGYLRYFIWRCIFSLLTFISLMVVFYYMANFAVQSV